MTDGLEMEYSSGTAVAVQPRQKVVVRTVREGTDNEEDNISALEAILADIPTEYREPLGAKSSAKEAWKAIATMRVGSDHAKKDLKFKDGRLRAVDERMEQATATKDSGKLLLTEEEWVAQRNSEVASSSHGGDGKRRGKASSEKKKKVDPNTCRRCRKTGHWARECPNRKQEKTAEAHLAQANDEDEATILMATFCALHDVEAEEKREVMAVKGPEKALKDVNLDEQRAQVLLGRVGDEQEQRWYLDSGAINHITGSKVAFFELDDDVNGTVNFDDGSRVGI
ncbi:uncharacterized protein [Miscanthus floridulus]|uniref:uncharacterized protein n=1 Tax=Miscanthus floridulus TaxID=154761 RepID=UPI003458E5FD